MSRPYMLSNSKARTDRIGPIFVGTLRDRKINFTNSNTLVGWLVSRPTVTHVTLDLPECTEPSKNENEKKRKQKKKQNKMKRNG